LVGWYWIDLEQADKHIQSWAYWQFKFFQDLTTASAAGGESFYLGNGTLDAQKVRALSRTYAQAIAGVPSVHSFDPLSSNFTLAYTINTVWTIEL
jgi:endoglycosylceramidase